MKKRYKRFYYTLIFLNIIFIIIVIQVFIHYYTKINDKLRDINALVLKSENNYILQQERIGKVEYDVNLVLERVNSVVRNVDSMKVIGDNYMNDMSLINAKINNIINTKPEEEKLKYTIIKTLNVILKKYYEGENFNNELYNLEILCKNNDKLLNDIKNLSMYSNIDIKLIKSSFENESKNLIIDTKTTVLKDLIKIEKISDKNKKKLIYNQINNIRSSIEKSDLEKALKFMREYGYQAKLTNTHELINYNLKFINLLKEVTNSI